MRKIAINLSKVKKTINLFFLTVFFILFQISYSYAAALTDSEQFDKDIKHKVIKLGLDLTTAIEEEQDARKGFKKFIKKTGDDWMWKSIGGYENLWTGQLEGEAYSVQIKQKVDKVLEIIENIQKFATAMGEGKYDEAAFVAIDQTVSLVDHPVVTALWATVKLTYESHKLVKETKVELDIERLYYKVERDRMILGVINPNEDSPKLIPVNTETVDYFFDKYIIKDEDTRGLVKSYVKNRLGQEWPEQSWWDRMFSWKSQENEETEKLKGEFRNVARGWIKQLLDDVNKQVKVRWGEARARQQLAEFKVFADQYKAFAKSLDELMGKFREIQEFKKEAKDYPAFIENSQKALREIKEKYEKTKDISVKRALYQSCHEWRMKCRIYGSRAAMIDNRELVAKLKIELEAWEKLIGTIYQDLLKITLQDVIAEHEKSFTFESDFKSKLQTFPFEWDKESTKAKEEILDALNTNNFKKAREIIDKWQSIFGLIQHHYYVVLAEKTGIRVGGAIVEYSSDPRENVLVDMYLSDFSKWTSISNELYKYYEAFENLKNARGEELSEFRKLLRNLYESLPVEHKELFDFYNVVLNINYPVGKDKYTDLFVKDAEEMLSKKTWYTPYYSIGKINLFIDDADIYGNIRIDDVEDTLNKKAKEVEAHTYEAEQTLSYFQSEIATAKKLWLDGLKKWTSTEKLDPKVIDEFTVFWGFNYQKEVPPVEKAANRVPTYINQLENWLNNFITFLNTEMTNSKRDADFLKEMAWEWKLWTNDLENKKLLIRSTLGQLFLKPNLNIDKETGMIKIIKSYSDATKEDYPRFLTAEEIKKTISKDPLYRAFDNLKGKKVYSFLKNVSSDFIQKLEKIITLGDAIPAKEENFILYNRYVIYKSNLDKAEELIKTTKSNSSDFDRKMEQISELLPGALIIQGTDKEEGKKEAEQNKKQNTKENSVKWQIRTNEAYDEMYKIFPLGQKFLNIRDQLAGLIRERWAYIQSDEEWWKDFQLKGLLDSIKNEIEVVKKSSITGDIEGVSPVDKFNNSLITFKIYYERIGKKSGEVENALKDLEVEIKNLESKISSEKNKLISKIQDFYNQFKQAYESRNESLVMSFIGDEWSAGDGTTLSDLRMNLSRTFRTFDEIRYNIQNLKIEPTPDGKYRSSYDITITSRIYKRNLKHEEKSSVIEEVIIDKSGRAKIFRTISGRFWYIQ